MPVVPMQKAVILGHQQTQNQVLNYLQKIGMLEITAPPFEAKAVESEETLELELAELEAAINLLEHISGKKKSLIESFAPYKETVEEEILEQTAREFDWRSVVAKLRNYESQLANLKNLEHTLRSEMEIVFPWQSLKVNLKQLACTPKTCVAVGALKLKEFESFKNKLEKFSHATQIETVSSTKEKTYLLIFYLAAESRILNDFFLKTSFEKALLPSSERTPAQEVAHLRRILLENKQDQETILKEIKSQLRHKASLTYAYDYLFLKNLERAARGKLAQTEKTFILTGWVPKENLPKLKAGLQKITSLAEVQETMPAKGEIPPTLIKNPKVFYPFELVTRIFGLPSQHEMDPTAPLSFFYLLFFAMCLSDVGYGIILSLVSLYFLRTLTLSEGGKKLLQLLFWGGIATVFVGILTGSYFGIDTNQLPPLLRQLQIIDPIKNPLNVLVLSLFLGVTQNLFGVALAMYGKIRNREYVSAILDHGLWIYFLLCLVLLVAASGLGSPLSGIFGKLSVIGAVLLILTQGRSESTLIKKLIFGVLSLYKTTGYLGDTLSYSRLLALMMTTSIIGMVINIIAGMTKGVPIFGYLFMAAILILGHTFNLIVSVLGAFIHSTRLQLVEFFGKFYEGGGREFKPFRREAKYVIIK